MISAAVPPHRSGTASASGSGLVATGPGAAATTAEIGRILEGSMLGPYRLDRFIGGGGMGAVFRALDTTLDRTVAVKVLAGQRSDDEEMLRRFRNEAQSAARLDHDNIGRVHAVGTESGWHYIVFEFIEGTNLRDVVREHGPLDLPRTIGIGIQIADALEHASRRDVVHRDIKPSNIVITPDGRARLVDMGLARLHHVAEDRDLTSSGMTIGTFDYISPEQARDPRVADVRSDLYSLGCTMFFMLAGQAPFAAGTMVQKLLQHQQTPPPAIDALRPDVPRGFAAILERLMAKDPQDRYQRPAHLVADLASFAAGEGYALASPRTLPPSSPAVTVASRLPWLLPTCGLSVLVALLWLRAADERHRLAAAVSPPAVPAPQRPGIVRVCPEPAGMHEVRTLGEAVRLVADGGVVEIAYDGEFREQPLVVAGRRLTIQPAAGMQPAVRFDLQQADGTADVATACDVGDGEIVVRRIGMVLDRAASIAETACLFRVADGRLTVEDAVLRVTDSPAGELAEPPDAALRSAVVFATPGQAGTSAATVRLDATRVAGDACFLKVAGGASGRVSLRWMGGAFVSPHGLVEATGSTAGPGIDIDCELADLVVATDAGVAMLADGPADTVPARLRVKATECRFVFAAPDRPLLEQSGGAAAELYRRSAEWHDDRSRYEGGRVFRRIRGPAGRVDEPFPATLLHLPNAGEGPDPGTWRAVGG